MIPEQQTYYFEDNQWSALQEDIIVSTRLECSELEILKKSPVARILAAIPYLAGCKNPDQIAVLEVSLYIAAMRNEKLFSHRANQTIKERIYSGFLQPLQTGDPDVVEFGFTLLELISLNDHYHDLPSDILTGHANPLKERVILYFPVQEVLQKKLESFDPLIYQSFKKLLPEDIVALDWVG